LVIRTTGGGGRQLGATHSQTPDAIFAHFPGLKVVAPGTPADAKGLLKAAVRDDNPVMVFEHKLLYGSKGARAESGAIDATSEIPEADYIVPLGTAAVRRAGSQVTVLAWLLMAHFSLAAAESLAAEGIDTEVVDVRSLNPFDYDTIGKSVRKTGRVVIVEEGPKTGGVAAELAAGITERFGESLLAPVERVASPDIPVPFAPRFENAYRPSPAQVCEAVRKLMDY
jgi:pyruvate dehydrogenase E1 component beta subunit